MSGIGAWIWGTSQLDDAVDKATSELLPAGGEDIALNLEICDQIRSKAVPAKDAMRALKRRLNHKNPNVQLLALSLTDICIKNGGDLFLVEIASREFMDNLVSILKIPALNHDVKNAILRLVQNWSIAFEGKYTLSYVGQVYKTLLNEGYKFPPKDLSLANSAMVDTQIAPEWIDSDVCLRCRTPFSFTNRKHHCRNCGQVFDQACSSKTMPLPHFGITQEVRVCDGCHSKLTKKAERTDKGHRSSGSRGHGYRHRSAVEFPDPDIQRAIQLSLQEANGHARPGYTPSQPSPSRWGYSEPPIVDRRSHPDHKAPIADEEDDPDLKAAIEASLQEANAPKPSAPIVETPRLEQQQYSYPAEHTQAQSYPSSTTQSALPKLPNYDLEPLEADAILTFNQTVEQLEAQGGRDISRYPAVNELYEKASGLRPKLALNLDDAGRKEQMLSDMHDKLSQAVKLYDQILTQQIAQPRWRTTQAAPVSPVSYQQQPAYNTGVASGPGYQQWAPQVQTHQTGQQAPMSPQVSYATPQEPASQSYYPQAQQAQPPQSQYAPTPTPAPPLSPPIPQSYQYQQFAPSAPPPSHSISQPAYNPSQPTPSSSIQSTPALSAPALPQSPPPQTRFQTPTPQVPSSQPQFGASLARHSTVSYGASPTPSHLARSNTVASHPPSQPVQQFQHRQQPQQYQAPPPQQPQQQQQYQVVSPPPAPVVLPQFPSVPTTAPQQAFPVYGSGFEQKVERKEALLIDL